MKDNNPTWKNSLWKIILTSLNNNISNSKWKWWSNLRNKSKNKTSTRRNKWGILTSKMTIPLPSLTIKTLNSLRTTWNTLCRINYNSQWDLWRKSSKLIWVRVKLFLLCAHCRLLMSWFLIILNRRNNKKELLLMLFWYWTFPDQWQDRNYDSSRKLLIS